jgi:hypothetical protein
VKPGSATVGRVPCVRRATAWVVVVGVAVMIGGGCGSDRKATGFCAEVERGRAGFDSTEPDRSDAALAALDRMIVSAPPTVAPALRTMSTELLVIYGNPKAAAKDPSILERYSAAVDRVDEYLRDECGLRIPSRQAG